MEIGWTLKETITIKMVAMVYLLDVRFLANRQQCKTYFPWPRGPELHKKKNVFSAGLELLTATSQERHLAM